MLRCSHDFVLSTLQGEWQHPLEDSPQVVVSQRSASAGAQIWVGVEFDDGKRGKHDGSRDGVQYFKAKTKTAGSFVKVRSAFRVCLG